MYSLSLKESIRLDGLKELNFFKTFVEITYP